jgi:ABC-type phosphate transport system substrate-binding protein
MSSLAIHSRRRRFALSVGGALAAALIAAPVSSADFTLGECQGALAPGQGATFQNSAFNGFKSVYGKEAPTGCGTAAAANITWLGSGSGAGRQALGERNATANPTGARNPGYRWAGADEPPNAAQRQQIESGPVDGNGADVTAADNNKLHVIPVAIGAIAVIVNLPNECTSYGAAPLYRGRPRVTLANLEKVWHGDVTTWGDLLPGIDPACAGKTIQRVVRQDSSGSTFAFKQAMFRINSANNDWRSLTNTDWPNKATAPLGTPVSAGGGNLAALVRDTPGSIGYADLATARSGQVFTQDGAFDKTFWLPVQRSKGDADTFDDPQSDADGYKKNNAARGANCAGINPQNAPDSTFGDWSQTDSTLSGTTYAICTLTYDLAFDDNAVVYCNSVEEQAKARTLKDYLEKAVLSTAGQASLITSDYDALPGLVLNKAKAGVASINWNKGGAGRPCSDEQPPAATPTPTPTPPGGGGTPPPPAISNKFTIASARVSGTTIRLSLQLPGAGKVSVASSAKPKKGKAITLAAKTVNATKTGAQTITLSLSPAAKKALKKDKKLKFAVKVTFTPAGGTANTVTKSVTVKQPKKTKGK